MAIYIVGAYSNNYHEKTIVEGPEVDNDDWAAYCDGLNEDVYKKALENNSKFQIHEDQLSEALIEILKDKGYKTIKVQEKSFSGEDELPFEIRKHNLQAAIENEKSWVERSEDEKTKEVFKQRINDLNEELENLEK